MYPNVCPTCPTMSDFRFDFCSKKKSTFQIVSTQHLLIMLEFMINSTCISNISWLSDISTIAVGPRSIWKDHTFRATWQTGSVTISFGREGFNTDDVQGHWQQNKMFYSSTLEICSLGNNAANEPCFFKLHGAYTLAWRLRRRLRRATICGNVAVWVPRGAANWFLPLAPLAPLALHGTKIIGFCHLPRLPRLPHSRT